jgi:hypothetical protein
MLKLQRCSLKTALPSRAVSRNFQQQTNVSFEKDIVTFFAIFLAALHANHIGNRGRASSMLTCVDFWRINAGPLTHAKLAGLPNRNNSQRPST